MRVSRVKHAPVHVSLGTYIQRKLLRSTAMSCCSCCCNIDWNEELYISRKKRGCTDVLCLGFIVAAWVRNEFNRKC